MNEAVQRLRDDLVGSGIDEERIAEIAILYANALTRRTREVWNDFYRAVFHALQALAAGSRECLRPDARESLLRILDDDLGHALFGDAASELRERLGYPRAEPRVSQTSATA